MASFDLHFAIFLEGTCNIASLIARRSCPNNNNIGCLAWTSVYPLDVIKSRMQAHPSRLGPGAWISFGREIYHEGGARAFLRGIKPTLARAFVMDALTFVGYTNVLRVLST
jgi:hypothetical protein